MTTETLGLNSLPLSDLKAPAPGRSLWRDAFYRLRKDPIAILCMSIIVLYTVIGLLTQLGWIASPWDRVVATPYHPPTLDSFSMLLGTDIFGRSVFYKVLHGTRIAMSVGLVSSVISIPIGVTLGALAGYFGGWVDDLVVWFYTTLSSIPNIMLLIAIAFILGRGLTAIYVALGVTSWVSLARIIRGEFIKHKSRDYVLAAESLGATHRSRIFKHILPNVSHFIIINLSIQAIEENNRLLCAELLLPNLTNCSHLLSSFNHTV